MSIQMAWFYNQLLTHFFEIGSGRSCAAAVQSGGNHGPQIRVFPKEFADFKNRASRKTQKTPFSNGLLLLVHFWHFPLWEKRQFGLF